MKSRNSEAENPTNGQLDASQPSNGEEDGGNLQGLKKKAKPQKEKDGENGISETEKRSQKLCTTSHQKRGFMDLSRMELLRFLGIMEGEVQAREDIIHMLKSQRTRPEALEAHYGSAVPEKALRALHRDGLMIHSQSFGDDVYEAPMAELDRLEDKHRETYRRMLEQLLLAEKCHRRTVHELDGEKRKHTDYMNKSDDFTNLLEQERERLKRLLEQEKAYQTRKDKEHSKHLEKVREELVKLKSFALMLVDERQLYLDQIDQHSQRIQDLAKQLQEKEQKLSAVTCKAKEDSQRILKLEVDLECKAAKFAQGHEEMTTKLGGQESQNRQMRLKLASMTRRIEELEESNQTLQRSEDELQALREKISKGECGNSSLMTELETLRKRVLEMEGKDEEIIKTESQCRELRKRLQDEESHCIELKLEVEKLQKKMIELEKLEGAFSISKSECTQLQTSLEKERGLVKELVSELDLVKNHVKELETSESRLEKAELGLKDDLAKLKSFTVIMVDERKKMAERIREEEKKGDSLNRMFKTEQCKVMEVTEKLIEESKKLLKLKAEMEAKVTSLVKEKEELKSKFRSEEEKCKDLSLRVSLMKTRTDHLEEAEREWSRMKRELEKLTEEDNRIKELMLEIERLKNRLKQLEVVEGDLMKTEDEYDLLEKKFRTEQDKANVLSQQLEEMRSQIARNKAIEKGEAVSQEAELRQRCKMEEAKMRDLQAEVQALKEKIHELMYKEDQLSQLQVDYSILQQRFIEEEKKKTNMSHEVLNLTKELEVTKRYSRAMRPSTNGRRMVDVPLASTGVQTDIVACDVTEDTPAVFIRKSFQEENHIMSNLRLKGLKKPVERPSVLDRYPPAANEFNMRKTWMPWMKKKEGSLESSHSNAQSPRTGTMPTSQRQGQPLHIRVTSDHGSSTATLEITSPSSEDFFSNATIIPTLGQQKPRITIVPKPTKAGESVVDLERAKSPVTITTISRAKSPETSKSDRPLSPISIVTVSTSAIADVSSSQAMQDMTMGRSVFKVTPEKQTVPTPKKFSNTSIITTTEDNKIHIHLGPQFKRPLESGCSPPTITVRPLAVTTESKDVATGTVLRSPRHGTSFKTTPGKVLSSVTITPITSAPSRSTQPGTDAPPPRTAVTHIPMSKGMKTDPAGVKSVCLIAAACGGADGLEAGL
ncbi:filamin-A-interacting protein 1-like isoform X4 [Conger conger]|uniref:filamin-A-interacting protein 1-like isoform X4 n=1 Tax=Conger conger TaxID=82655 RepID=UPI002A5A3628|nr:filamin-A-interacting protein 1-like isoform X4 [Conger conger]